MVKALPSNAEDAGSILGQGSKILHPLRPKNQNRKNIATNSIKILKMFHIRKILKRRKKKNLVEKSSSQPSKRLILRPTVKPSIK